MTGIYKITSPSNRIYIGQAVDIDRRFKEYKNLNSSQYQVKLHNSFKKYDIETHVFEVIEECDANLLNEKERYWQDYYDVLNGGLNCILQKTDDKSGKVSDETKLKLSISGKGRKFSKEHIEKLAEFHRGRKRSDESKRLMSEKAKNKIVTDETRKKQSLIRTGTKRSEESKLKMSEAKKGKLFSEEHKLNISLSKRGGKHKDAKKVICTRTGVVWECIKDCAKENNISYASLRRYLSGKRENKTTLILLKNE